MMTKSELKELLQKNIVNVTFKKVNGETRVLKSTLKSDMLPKIDIVESIETKPKKPESDSVVACWDIENQGWRSFRVDSVTEIEVIES